ncbi:hypothetical protein C8R46DRAFT_426651 [Mycena filopes]|nr:hypothetical protein C8R46DRAFT_426651 [Mycena filopes]
MCEAVAPTSDEVEEDATVDSPPRAKTVQDERRLYLEYVGGLQQPTGLPPIRELKPIYSAAGSQLECGAYLHKSIGIKKPFLFVPNRVMWCPDSQHALLFCPTHLYDRLWGDWWERSPEAAPAGQSKELFVNAGDSTAIIYAGTYIVRSLRHVHSPGSPLPGHLSGRQINLAAGIGDKPNAYYPIEDRFPDGQISTECFGLQRVGFDMELYATLLARYEVADVTAGQPAKKKRKRKKGAETVALQEGAPV